MRGRTICCAALASLCLIATQYAIADRQRPAQVRILGLPAGAHLYVDGKAARATGGVVAVSAGAHTVQVEVGEAGGVKAYRRCFEAPGGAVVTVRVALLPVRLGGRFLQPAGVSGPEGPEGPEAPRLALPGPGAATDRLAEPLRVVLVPLLEAMRYDADRAREALRPGGYWFATGESVDLAPAGNAGEPGPEGLAAPPDAALDLVDGQGVSILERAKGWLQIPALAKRLGAVRAAGERLLAVSPERKALAARIEVLTPALRQRLTREWEAAVEAERQARATGAIIETFGPEGPRGARGPARAPTAARAARPVVLSAEQVRQLRELLTHDRDLAKRIAAVRQVLTETEAWVQEDPPPAGP